MTKAAPEYDQDELNRILKLQKQAFWNDGFPSLEVRSDRLKRLLAMIVKYEQAICEAITLDYGNRSREVTRMTDVLASIDAVKQALTHLPAWMEPETQPALYPANEAGATAEIRYQPKGVVGIVGPWNFPVHLVLGPLASVLAAGNRAIIKPSEITANTAALLEDILTETFDETEIAVVQGGVETSKLFIELPFDHLMFTGSTAVGKILMKAAAENLVPVTLELGGKSPVIVGKDADLKKTAHRLAAGKLFNSGQICVCPDYAFIPQESFDSFIAEFKSAVAAIYPNVENNPDYASIVNDHHFDRLQNLVTDAEASGAEIIEINPARESFDQVRTRKMLPKLIINAGDDSAVMNDEIFGPLFPIRTYSAFEEIIDYLGSHPRPLALYYFGEDESERKTLVNNVISGGMTINDVITHVINYDLPLGGIGASGMGGYRGVRGFREFSHAKSIYTQTNVEEIAAFMRPPYSEEMKGLLDQLISVDHIN